MLGTRAVVMLGTRAGVMLGTRAGRGGLHLKPPKFEHIL